MKCENCGGSLSLEAMYCPHCGTINKHAQQHIQDMNRYEGEFKDTQEDVYNVSRNYAGIAVRAGIITGLLIIIVILLIIAATSYDIKRALAESKANRRYNEYSVIMEQYLAEGNYMAFDSFCEKNSIYGYDTRYESYIPIMRACSSYKYLYNCIMEAYVVKLNPRDEMYAEHYMENLARQVESFYESLDMENYVYYEGADSEKNHTTMEHIEENVRVLLKAYCGLTEEDLAEWDSLTNAKRRVILEERMGNAE